MTSFSFPYVLDQLKVTAQCHVVTCFLWHLMGIVESMPRLLQIKAFDMGKVIQSFCQYTPALPR